MPLRFYVYLHTYIHMYVIAVIYKQLHSLYLLPSMKVQQSVQQQ